MELTTKQQHVLDGLPTGPAANPVSARRLADQLERPGFHRARYSRGEVYGVLTRLERKGLVKRHGEKPIQWVRAS